MKWMGMEGHYTRPGPIRGFSNDRTPLVAHEASSSLEKLMRPGLLMHPAFGKRLALADQDPDDRPRTISSGATVWASHSAVGTAWKNRPKTSGWSHLLEHVHGLEDICQALDKEGLRGRVGHLAIVSHGDDWGQVKLDPVLTVGTVTSPFYRNAFNELSNYLLPDGMLTFCACVAGKNEPGSRLLVAISNLLRGRTIVGFEVFGVVNIAFGGPGNDSPGIVRGTMSISGDGLPDAEIGALHPWCRFAKRARNGRVVHMPMLEQRNRSDMTCANPSCPGHRHPSHACPGW